ncbi:hypothetical protein Ancab_001095 [Ancistrocladus abbreviatus]
MSASTVSITANPAARTRRRPVVVGDNKRQNLELVNDAAISPNFNSKTAAASGGVGDEVTAAGADKDLSHSIRGEAVLERTKEILQIKKSQLPNSTISPRRSRKTPATKPEKPRWMTVVSIFAKNFVLLIVLLGLIQLVRKWVVNSRTDVPDNLMGFSDMEGRISEVDSSLKTMTKMMQVQLETIDRKIETEVGSLRKEVNRKFEDRGVEFDAALKKLDEKSNTLEKALSELRAKELLTKDDFTKLYDELKNAKVGDLGQMELSLDEIRGLAREIVEKEIDKHAADGLARVDYALASAGAMVTKHSEPFIIAKGVKWFTTMSRHGVHGEAEKMLKPSFGEPGQCFPLKGSSGFVEIRLRAAIIPEAITLEHVAKNVAYDRSSAPKDIRIFGWLYGLPGPHDLDNQLAVDGEQKFLLTEFTYDLGKSNAQTINVFDSASSTVIDHVRFEFTSNHGSPLHTCIYRLRVHGHEPGSASMVATDS